MTTLHVLGSGSKGNCFALHAGGRTLLIDAGFSAKEIHRRASASGLDLAQVVGIALTHEHGDHSAGVRQLARRLDVPVLSSLGTWGALRHRLADVEARHIPLALGRPYRIGPFTVDACPISHDAAEPLALVVRGEGGPAVGVAYDLGRPTQAVRYLLRGLDALVLEANYDEILLRTSGYPPSVQQRIAGSGGHLSNGAAAELLAELCHAGLQHVVLAHLSERCNTPAAALGAVGPALRSVGFEGGLHVATQAAPLPALPLRHSEREALELDLGALGPRR